METSRKPVGGWLHFGRLLSSDAALGECSYEHGVCWLYPWGWPLGFPYVNSRELDIKKNEYGNSKYKASEAKGETGMNCAFLG